jgi:hypothetical protein
MRDKKREEPVVVEGPPPAGFHFGALGWWLPACAAIGAATAWLADRAGQHWAPLAVFPLLVGLALGAALAGLMRLGQVGNRATILAGALVGVTVAVVGQHYAAYLAACDVARQDAATFRLAREAFGHQVAGRLPTPPAGLTDFLRREARRGRPISKGVSARGTAAWLTWMLDALLLATAALVLVARARRRPYCDDCRSWFQTTRRGRIDAATAAQVAAAAGIERPEGAAGARYRLVTCNAGCRTAGFELCWEGPDGKPATSTCWLDAAGRNELMRKLDAPLPNE